ncbi:hypothetical protein UCRPC4_g03625 [Phaeomoniella chlamydospora]|uniref:Uncharacterized protein n=1 Tax=Phaeomoniella chlamydospora TaxID=158046 RepID=A0A0G2EH28_PHACM|nr:hypothetical protein UCRPC4_g03625 [Phaeomoniella chlamydospora]
MVGQQTKTNSFTMSAPNEGRQSPEPERQTGAQLNEPPSSGKIGESGVPDGANVDTHAKQSSDKTKNSGLESNPVHPLAQAAEDKVSKS